MLEAGASLARGLASARLLFGTNFQPSESLKALVCFNDGDLQALSGPEKKLLIDAVKTTRDLPEVRLRAKELGLNAGQETPCAIEAPRNRPPGQ